MQEMHELLRQTLRSDHWTITQPADGMQKDQKEYYVASDGSRRVFVKFDVAIDSLQRLGDIGVAPCILAHGSYGGRTFAIQEFFAGAYPTRDWIQSHLPLIATLVRTYHQDGPLTSILASRAAARNHQQHIDQELEAFSSKLSRLTVPPTVRHAFAKFRELGRSLAPTPLVPTHNDPNTKNILVGDERIVLIDWDEALLSDPIRDIGPFLWWYVPRRQWPEFFDAYRNPFTPEQETKIYWFAARTSLAVYLWRIEYGHQAGGFDADFLSALGRHPNPRAAVAGE